MSLCILRARPLIALHMCAGQELDGSSFPGGSGGKVQKFFARTIDPPGPAYTAIGISTSTSRSLCRP